MKTISTPDLTRWLDDGEDIVLLDVLPQESFRKQHIPGAANLPVGISDFEKHAEQYVDGDKKRRVVVYCANTACDASPRAAQKLEAAGFTKVYDYEAGLEGYATSGRKLVGAPV